MKMSIIVPIYNAQDYLSRCIDSILKQTFTDFECILVDDCSFDNSPQICDDYAKRDKRIKVAHKIKNEGTAQARKTGISISSSAGNSGYVLFIDNDDYIEKEMVQELYNKAVSGNYDMVFCDYYRDLKDEKFYCSQSINDADKTALIKQVISWGKFLPVTWNKLVKIDIYNKVVFPQTTYSEDRVIMTQVLFYAQKIAHVNKAFYHWVDNKKSASRNKKNRLNNVIDDYIGYVAIILFIKKHLSKHIDKYAIDIYKHINNLSFFGSQNSQIFNIYKKSIERIIKCVKSDEYDKEIEITKYNFAKFYRKTYLQYIYQFWFKLKNLLYSVEIQDKEIIMENTTNKFPLCSVCCLSYNHEKFIKFCIQSIFDQTYKNIEIIVLDDGSNDNSAKLLNELSLKSPYPMTVIVQENSGNIAKNMNTMIAHSKGDYIAYVSCDDALPKYSIVEKIQLMQTDKNICCVISNKYYEINENEKITRKVEDNNLFDGMTANDILNLEYENFHSFFCQGAVFDSRLIKSIGFDEQMIGEDIVLRIKICLYMKQRPYLRFRVYDKIGFYYRFHTNNLSKNLKRQICTVSQVLDRFFADKPAPDILAHWIREAFNKFSFSEAYSVFSISPKCNAQKQRVLELINNDCLLKEKKRLKYKKRYQLLMNFLIVSLFVNIFLLLIAL